MTEACAICGDKLLVSRGTPERPDEMIGAKWRNTEHALPCFGLLSASFLAEFQECDLHVIRRARAAQTKRGMHVAHSLANTGGTDARPPTRSEIKVADEN